jgi:hypothetical protein
MFLGGIEVLEKSRRFGELLMCCKREETHGVCICVYLCLYKARI